MATKKQEAKQTGKLPEFKILCGEWHSKERPHYFVEFEGREGHFEHIGAMHYEPMCSDIAREQGCSAEALREAIEARL